MLKKRKKKPMELIDWSKKNSLDLNGYNNV